MNLTMSEGCFFERNETVELQAIWCRRILCQTSKQVTE